MLNNNDVSDYLKISPTGLEVSNGFIYLFNDKIVLLLKFITVEHQSRGCTVMNTDIESLLNLFKFFIQLSECDFCGCCLKVHIYFSLFSAVNI